MIVTDALIWLVTAACDGFNAGLDWFTVNLAYPYFGWIASLPNVLWRIAAVIGTLLLLIFVFEGLAQIPIIGLPFKLVCALFHGLLWATEHFFGLMLLMGVLVFVFQFVPGLLVIIGLVIAGAFKL